MGAVAAAVVPGLNLWAPAVDYWDVDQVSRPMLIALAAVVLLAGAWFTVLQPKDDADSGSAATPAPAVATAAKTTATKAPGQAGLGRAVAKANGAVATSKSSAAATEKAAANASGGTEAATSSSSTAKAGATTKASTTTASGDKPITATTAKKASEVAAGDPSGPILAELDKGRTVVVVFSERDAADDAGARRAVRRLGARDKKVFTADIPLSEVAKYAALTTNVEVLTSPTVLVIGPHRKALSTTGYTDVQTLTQLVGDVRRDAGK